MSGRDCSHRYTYSNEEYADILLCYGYCSGDSAAARREYVQRFPDRHTPNGSVFSSVYRRIRETGSVRGRTSDVDRPSSDGEESEEEIQSFAEYPTVPSNATAVSLASAADEPELKTEIEKILKGADLRVWTTKKVTQHLESQFGPGVWEKRAKIFHLVKDYINSIDDTEFEEDEASKESRKQEKLKRAVKSHTSSEEEEVESESDESSDDENTKAERDHRASPKPRVTEEKTTKAKKATGKAGGSGSTRSYKLSPALAALMGTDEMTRPAVVKRIWAILKENNLLDPNNRQFAICDDALFKVIGKKRFKTFAMMRYLKGHFLE